MKKHFYVRHKPTHLPPNTDECYLELTKPTTPTHFKAEAHQKTSKITRFSSEHSTVLWNYRGPTLGLLVGAVVWSGHPSLAGMQTERKALPLSIKLNEEKKQRKRRYNLFLLDK